MDNQLNGVRSSTDISRLLAASAASIPIDSERIAYGKSPTTTQ